jgi:hypothetical protein
LELKLCFVLSAGVAHFFDGAIKSKLINTNLEFKADFEECVGRKPTLDEIIKFQDGKNILEKEEEEGLNWF